MLLPVLTQYENEHIPERQPLPDRYLGLSGEEMERRIAAAKAKLGRRVVILGHHYQRDEVIKFAGVVGELDDFVALIMMAEDHHSAAELRLSRGDAALHLLAGEAEVPVGQRLAFRDVFVLVLREDGKEHRS